MLGQALHPAGTSNFSSYLLTAQGSGAKVVALANAGEDTKNAVKQGTEFGLGIDQRMLNLLTLLPDMHGLGIDGAHGLLVTESFYWSQDEKAAA